MSKVLVACSRNSRNVQEVPYMLKRGGCEIVDVLCSTRSSLLRNTFFDEWIEFDNTKIDFNTLLLQTIERNKYDWIILGDDTTLKLMNDVIKDEETFVKVLPMTKIENRKILSSKIGLSEVCDRHSIATPKYLVLENIERIDEAVRNLKFPVLTKVDVSQGGRGIRFCNNVEQLKRAVLENPTGHKIIVQEFISGKDFGAEALYKDGKLLTYNVAEVLGYLENKFGRTTKRRYFFDLEVEKLLLELGEKLGLNGFASIQYIYDQSENIYYLVEADLRPNIWVASSRFTGNDFSDGIRRYMNLLPITIDSYKPANGYDKSFEIALFNRDIVRCVKQKKPLQLLRWFYDYKYWRFIPTYDRKQLRFQFRNTVRDIKNTIKGDISNLIRRGKKN